MFTLFTVPKPFEGHIGVIQRNAVGSWARLRPACEVLIFGDAAGTADTAHELAHFHRLDVRAATHVLTPTRLRTSDLAHLGRRLFNLPKFYLPATPAVRALYAVWRRRIRGLNVSPGLGP